MSNIEIPPFYVGQEIVAIHDHSQGKFKKGEEFKVTDIWKGCCDTWTLSVGIAYDFSKFDGTTRCTVCRKSWPVKKGLSQFNADCFRPKIEISSFISMSEVVKLETVGAN